MWALVGAAFAIGGLGILAAFALGVAAKVFYVEIDPLVLEIEEALPGANCGGCGQPGCSGAAVAIAQGKMPANACVAGGSEVGIQIAAIMGVEIRETEPQIARIGCRYPVARADIKFNYDGVEDCRAAFLLTGGPKECPVGCIGLGSCVKSCPFDALLIGPDNLPVVNEARCTGCGTCVRTCPAGIMRLTSISNRILDEYDWDICTAPCQRRCPAGIDIPRQIYHTAQGDYEQALLTIKERNPLPLICGRICPNPCEIKCRRNLVDEPVAINHLKRYVADLERLSGNRLQCYKAPETGHKAAIIGGGVEGLSAAYFLTRLGHNITIFESRPELGGLLRHVIPESRLPRDVLDWEIQGILDLGVETQTSKAFGRDFSLNQLFGQGYEAVLMATGGWDALLMPGDDFSPAPAIPGIYMLLPLTMTWARGQEVDLGSSVVVIGNDKNALAAARRCLDKGVKKIIVLGDFNQIEPADLNLAIEAGVELRSKTAVTQLAGVGDRLDELTYIDDRAVSKTIKIDTIITCSGRLPDMIIAREQIPEAETTGDEQDLDQQETVTWASARWHTILPYRPPHHKGDLFDTSDPISDYRAAVEAIGAGRRAAASIHYLLLGEDLPILSGDIVNDPPEIDVNHLENLIQVDGRTEMPEATSEQRLDPTMELALGLTEKAARAEASRCLNCGLICYYRTKYH